MARKRKENRQIKYFDYSLLFIIIFVLMSAMNLVQLASDRKKSVIHAAGK